MQIPEPNNDNGSGRPQSLLGRITHAWALFVAAIGFQSDKDFVYRLPEPENIHEIAHEEGRGSLQSARERIAHAWRLLSDYWLSRHWKRAWILLLAYIGLQMAGVAIILWVTVWQRHFYDSIQSGQEALFIPLILTFVMILLSEVLLILTQSWISMNLAIGWRQHLTERYLGRWFARDRFYEIERLRLVDNPDQRIAEDINSFTNASGSSSLLGLIIGFCTQLISAVSFIVLMAPSTRPITFVLAGYTISMPYDLILFAFIYAIAGTVIVAWIGKAYVRRSMRQQHLEGDFRSYLVHVRRNAAQISFMGSQEREHNGLSDAFGRLKNNYRRLILALMGLNFGQSVYQRIEMMIPLFILVRRFFRGEVTFGQVMAGQNAFVQLVSNLSFLISAYGGVATMLASLNRLKALDDAIDLKRPRGIEIDVGDAENGMRVSVHDLKLRRPKGELLADIGNWTVREGERWVIQGASGAGKSTLLRAIAGLWPDGSGKVFMARGASAMLVPQRLYLPLGTLKQAVCFPDDAEQHDDAAIADLLRRVRLSAHIDEMHQVRMWHEELSPGEQQRIALARILLHRPSLVVLDEATSALDADNARYFHETMLHDLPKATLISVVHDTKVLDFYTHCFLLRDGLGSIAALHAKPA